LEMRRPAIVDSERIALVLEKQPDVRGDEFENRGPDAPQGRQRPIGPMQSPSRVAAFQTVHARCRKPERVEQLIQLFDPPAADEGNGSLEGDLQCSQDWDESRIRANLARRSAELDQRPVEVEEEAYLICRKDRRRMRIR